MSRKVMKSARSSKCNQGLYGYSVSGTLKRFPRYKDCSRCGKMLVREFDDTSVSYEHVNLVYSPYSHALIYDAPRAITCLCLFDYEELELSDIEYEILREHELEGPYKPVSSLSREDIQVLRDEVSEVLQGLNPGEFVRWRDVAVQSQTIEHILFMYWHNDYYLSNPKVERLITAAIAAVTTGGDKDDCMCSHIKPVYVKTGAGAEVLVWANIQGQASVQLPTQQVLAARYNFALLDHLDGNVGKHALFLRLATDKSTNKQGGDQKL